MCGLVGVVGRIYKKENEAFKDLLRVDVLRGPHSTGIAARPRMQQPKILKKALLPDDLFAMKQATDLFNEYGVNEILMGHNRWATTGAVNHVNAHPFELDKIVGAHNGTLRKQHLLPDHTQFKVDSENIFHSFEKLGVKDTIKLLDGAFALTWFERDENTMHFVRNKERTLYYCFTEDNKTFFYASEPWMLEGVLARHKIEHQGVIPFDPMFHYKLDVPYSNGEFDKFYMSAVEGYEPPKSTGRWNQARNGNGTIGKGTVTNMTDHRTNQTSKTGKTGGTSDLKKQSKDTGEDKGTSHETGDYVTFCVSYDETPQPRYLVGRDVFNSSTMCKLYLPKGAILRKKMLADTSEWWVGIVNGKDKHGNLIVQGNSIRSYDEYEEEQYRTQQAANDAIREEALEGTTTANNDEAWERHVTFIAGVGRCSWCDEILDPTDNNRVEGPQTVFCPSCRKLSEVREIYPEQEENPF